MMTRDQRTYLLAAMVPFVFACMIAKPLLHAVESPSWPVAKAEMLKRWSAGKTGRYFIRYRYTVHGVTYESGRVDTLGDIYRGGDQVGDWVNVHYRPSGPEYAILYAGWNSRHASALFAILAISLICFGAALSASKPYRKWCLERQRKRRRNHG